MLTTRSGRNGPEINSGITEDTIIKKYKFRIFNITCESKINYICYKYKIQINLKNYLNKFFELNCIIS